MRISDWSSDVCSSDLVGILAVGLEHREEALGLAFRLVLEALLVGLGPLHHAQRLAAGARQDVVAIAVGPLGRASCREGVCQYVYISVVPVSLTKTPTLYTMPRH